MLSNEASASTTVIVLNPVSAANTAAATSGWIDVRDFEGDIILIQQVGAVTGSITTTVEDATSGAGAGAATLTGYAFTAVSSANNVQKLVIPAGLPRGWIRTVGTVVTGPAITAVSATGRPKYA
jgi:hypothetical protein